MKPSAFFVAATLLVAASQPGRAQINVDMNEIRCGHWLGYGPEVRDFVRQLNISYPIVIDNTGDLVYKYRITGRPTSIFINKDGLITGIVPGMTTPQVLEEQLSRVLQ